MKSLLLGIFLTLVVFAAGTPVSVYASQTVFSGSMSDSSGSKPVMTYLPGGEICNFYAGCFYYAPGYTAYPIPVKQLIDEDGAVNHYTNPDSLTFGNGQAYSWKVHGGSDTVQTQNKTGGKTCALIDSTSFANWTTSSFASPHDNLLVRWGQVPPYTVWQKATADDIGNSYIENLTCKTNALPANAITASPTTILSGESSVLSFDMGPNALVQRTICTATNFTIPTHNATRLDHVPSDYDCDLEGTCTPRAWMPVAITYDPFQPEQDTSGTISVSPTETTTYTYSCTNGNGTTVKTATVTVGTPQPAADVTFSASPTSVPAGTSANLTWTSTNATSCSSATFTTGSATAGTVAVTPSTTTTYSISCTGPGGSSAVKYATVTVTASQADLTASTGSVTTAAVNTPVTLTGSVTNSGAGAAGAFPNIVQVCDSGSGCGVINTNGTLAGTSVSSLGAGATQAVSASYTPASATPIMYRVCANVTSSWSNVVSESNYGNNCGAWVNISVSSPSVPVTSCTVSPSSLATVPGSVTWSASPSNLGSYTWTPSEGGAPGGTGANLSRTYNTVGTYGMSVTAGGATVSCPNITAGAVCGTASPTLTASPTRVVSGGTSTLTLSAGGVDSTCTLTGPGINTSYTPTSCNVSSRTVTTPAITNQSVYTLSCDGGERTAQAVVNIIPKVQEF